MKNILISLTLLASISSFADDRSDSIVRDGVQAYTDVNLTSLDEASREILELRNSCYSQLSIDDAKVECSDVHNKWLKLKGLSNKLRMQKMIDSKPLTFEESEKAVLDIQDTFSSASSKKEMYKTIDKASSLVLKVEDEDQLFNLRILIRKMFRVAESK